MKKTQEQKRKYQREYMREWTKGNKEKKKLADKKYREENREKINKHNRKMNKIWNDNSRFSGNRELVLERDNWECIKCGMNQEQHIVLFGRSLTVDHIDGNGRYSDKPNNNLSNLQTLCLRCHGKKDGGRR